MLTIDSPEFVAELEKETSAPRLLVEFHFLNGVRYLSDTIVGVDDGLAVNYEPIIKNWGQLRDNVNISPIVAGNSLETRQLTLSIINTGSPRFTASFISENPENVKVYLYQWFVGLPESDKQLIDVFVVQDPINISEAQATVSIQLVSPIMVSNNYVWGPNRTVDVRYPLVVGKATVLAKSPDPSPPIGFLTYDLDFDDTADIYIQGATDFLDGGTISIDSEQLTYTGFSVNKFTGIVRGVNGTTARPHIRGALVCNPADVFDYTLTAGPVEAIDNLQADGTDYNNPYTAYPGENPSFIRFLARPPWHKSEEGEEGPPIVPDPETSTQYGASYNTNTWDGGGTFTNSGSINTGTAGAYLAIDNTVGGAKTVTSYSASYSANDSDWPGARIYHAEYFNTPVNSSATYTGYVEEVMSDDGDARFTNDTVFSMSSIFNRNFAGYGTLNSASAYVYFKFVIEGVECLCEVIQIVSGVEHVKWSATLGDLGGSTKYTTEEAININILTSASTWSKIQNSTIMVRATVTDGGGTVSGTERCEMYVSGETCFWTFTYYDGDSVATSPAQALSSHFNRDLSSLGSFTSLQVQVTHNLSISNATVTQSIHSRQVAAWSGLSQLWSGSFTSGFSWAYRTLYPTCTSWSTLQNMRISVYHQVTGPTGYNQRRQSTTGVAWVKWIITYQPPDIVTPDEERITYVTELTADVTGAGGAVVTPPDAVRRLLENVGGMAEYVDDDNVDELVTQYEAGGFYFNGLIDGETRFHEALKDMLRQSLQRIIYNAGTIRLTSSFYNDPTTAPIDIFFQKQDARLRSVSETRMKVSEVINRVILQYDLDFVAGEWIGEVTQEDATSIATMGVQESSLTYSLIESPTIAAEMADKILLRVSTPKTFSTFSAYMRAFPLEKVDNLYIETDFNDYDGLYGSVLTVNRVFGNATNGTPNYYQITFTSTPITTHSLDLADTVEIRDELTTEAGAAFPTLDISETIDVNDPLTLEAIRELTLNISETVELSGTLERDAQRLISLDISETVEISDEFITDTAPYYLNISETLGVQSVISSLLVSSGYGSPGYGGGGYGGGFGVYNVYFKTDYVTFDGDDVTFPII